LEALILFIIFGLIGSYLSNKSKGQQKTSTPPIRPQKSRPKVEIKTLDEFAREIYEQLKDEAAELKKETVQKVEIKEKQPEVQQPASPSSKQAVKKEQPKETTVLPKKTMHREKSPLSFLTSKEALVNAVIAQEILGPPKSKKR